MRACARTCVYCHMSARPQYFALNNFWYTFLCAFIFYLTHHHIRFIILFMSLKKHNMHICIYVEDYKDFIKWWICVKKFATLAAAATPRTFLSSVRGGAVKSQIFEGVAHFFFCTVRFKILQIYIYNIYKYILILMQ